MSYSLQQAAEATGKNRSTIQRAIKKGRISALLNEAGAYEIDPAELHRVFPPVAQDQGKTVARQQSATSDIASENRELRAKVELLREMVEDLRERLDAEADERRQNAAEVRRLTLILTDQRQPAPSSQPEAAPLQPEIKPKTRVFGAYPVLWLGLVVALVTFAASWWLGRN
jgi:hypothetical protein